MQNGHTTPPRDDECDRPVPLRRRASRWWMGGAVAGVTAMSGTAMFCPGGGGCGSCGACAALIPAGIAVAAIAQAVLRRRR